MTNKYIFHSKISEKKFREIIRYFSHDIEASKIAALTVPLETGLPLMRKITYIIIEGAPHTADISRFRWQR